jgi:3-oxoadipate enol-lactonase
MHIPPKQFLEVFTTRVAYVDTGEGSALVCLHGALDCADTFASLIEANDFARIIAFDLPGSGESSLPPDPFYGLMTTARYLAEALEQKGLNRVVLLGHEHGAGVAILLASLDPERVKGLCLLGSMLTDQSSPRFLRGSSLSPFRWLSRYTLGETMLRWRLNARMLSKVHPERPARLAKLLSHERRARLSILQKITETERETIDSRLRSLEVPVLFIQGDYDRLLSREKAKQRQEQCKNSRLEFVPGCAQYPHEEKPLEVALLLKTWLAELDLDTPRQITEV